MNDSDSEEGQEMSRHKYSKKGYNVPANELGFRAKLAVDILDPRNLRKSNPRAKKVYNPKLTKQNFLSRLRMVVDVYDLPVNVTHNEFRVCRPQDWGFVKKVYYRSHELSHCSICLEENIIAPQITFCGHIFCFHCILMHFKKSENSGVCPVCKEYTDEKQIKTCEPIYDKQLQIGNSIKMKVKFRVGSTIFQKASNSKLIQDLNFSQIIAMRSQPILTIFQSEQSELQKQLLKTVETDRNHHYLLQALSISQQKIARLKLLMEQHQNQRIKLQQNEKIYNDTIKKTLKCQQPIQQNLLPLYQEESGKYIFLHSICKKYLKQQKLEQEIEAKIIGKEDTKSAHNHYYQYKELMNLNVNTDFNLVILDLREYLPSDKYEKFMKEVEQYFRAKETTRKRQEAEQERLNKVYEEQQAYLRKIKVYEQSQFDIKMPAELDPSDINQHSFPSLIDRTSSELSALSAITVESQSTVSKSKSIQIDNANKKIEKFDLSNQQMEDFPELSELRPTQSQNPHKNTAKGGRKKKKEKRIDITHELFFQKDDC